MNFLKGVKDVLRKCFCNRASYINWLVGLAMTMTPELSLANGAIENATPDISGHFGWSCWSARNEEANVRVQVNLSDETTQGREYQIRVISAPNTPDESPILVASIERAVQRAEDEKIIYEGSTRGESAELRIHTKHLAEDGLVSSLILERDKRVLTTTVPIVSVINLECAETRLPK